MDTPGGARQSAADLFHQHGAAVYRFAAILLRNHQDAEDVVQETFLKLLHHLTAGGNTDHLRGWLFMVLITAGPAYWLFHPTFVQNVILPMLKSISAI